MPSSAAAPDAMCHFNIRISIFGFPDNGSMVHVFSSVWLLNWRLADSSGAWGEWAGGGLLAPGLHTQSAHYWAQQHKLKWGPNCLHNSNSFTSTHTCIYNSACAILLLQICHFLVIGQSVCTAKKFKALCIPEVKNTTSPPSSPGGNVFYCDRWKLVPVYRSKGLQQCHSVVLTHVQTYRNTRVETQYT